MNQLARKKATVKAMEKAIKASIKKEIAARGINTTTRQGNKELKFLVNRLASQSFETLEEASTAGEKMGQHLSELLQQKNKQNLDAGLIRQVTYQKNFWSLAGLSISQPNPNPTTISSEEETLSQTTISPTTAEIEATDKAMDIAAGETEKVSKPESPETSVATEIEAESEEVETIPSEEAAEEETSVATEIEAESEEVETIPPEEAKPITN